MKETSIQNLIRLEASKLGATLFRNETGRYKLADGRWLAYGLCKGGCDLIGWYKGRFLGVEVKRTGKKPDLHQQNFINQVNASGGIAFVARSVEEFKEKMKLAG